MPKINARQIDVYLDRFEAASFSAGTWNSPPGQIPWFDFNETVMEFHQAASADAETIQRLFTTHVRADRFCEGHLASMFKKGHIVALLRRLKELRRTMDD